MPANLLSSFYMNVTQDYTVNQHAQGRVRIWEHSPELGYGKLLLDRPNLITKIGAGLAAQAIAGLPNCSITHIYVGYNNSGDSTPTISDTVSSFSTYAAFPLAFSPSFSSTDSSYVNNLAYFTTYITGTTLPPSGSGLPSSSNIYSLGLVNRSGSINSLFSKIAFSPITYDGTHGLAISWGVTFTAAAS